MEGQAYNCFMFNIEQTRGIRLSTHRWHQMYTSCRTINCLDSMHYSALSMSTEELALLLNDHTQFIKYKLDPDNLSFNFEAGS